MAQNTTPEREVTPVPQTLGFLSRGAYTGLAWIDEDGTYHETYGIFEHGVLKVGGREKPPFIRNVE